MLCIDNFCFKIWATYVRPIAGQWHLAKSVSGLRNMSVYLFEFVGNEYFFIMTKTINKDK